MRGNWQTPDIVERLRLQARRSNDRWGLYVAAADTIEKLRAERDEARYWATDLNRVLKMETGIPGVPVVESWAALGEES